MPSREHILMPVNLSDRTTKAALMQAIGQLHGMYDVDVKPVDPSRSDPQNRYFHGVVVRAFWRYLNDPGHGSGKRLTELQVKEILVTAVLGTEEVFDPHTGEVIGSTRPSTAALSKPQFADMIDRSVAYLADKFGIVVPPPSLYYTKEPCQALTA